MGVFAGVVGAAGEGHACACKSSNRWYQPWPVTRSLVLRAPQWIKDAPYEYMFIVNILIPGIHLVMTWACRDPSVMSTGEMRAQGMCTCEGGGRV